jgi:MFS family permease
MPSSLVQDPIGVAATSSERFQRRLTILAARLPIAWSVSFLFFVVGIFYYSAQFAVWDAPFTLGLSDSDAELLFSYRDIGFAVGLILGLMLLRVFTVRALMLRSAIFFLTATILMPFLDSWFPFLKVFFFLVGFITGVLYLTGYSLLSRRAAKSRDFICAILQIEGFFGLGLGSSFLFFAFFTGATNSDLSWGLGYGLLFPLLLLITVLLRSAQIPEKEPPFSIFEVRRLYGKLAFFSFNPLVLISIFCVVLLTFIEVHFQNWVDFFSAQLIDAGEWQFHRPLIQVLILLALALSKFGASLLLRKLTPAFYFLLSVALLAIAVVYAATLLGKTQILAASHLKMLSPTFFFIPLMAFLMSPLPILVYILLAQRANTETRLLLVVILTIVSRLGWLYLPRLSNFFYKNFIGHVAYHFTLIPLALLFVLFFLNYFDLKNKNAST